MPAKGDINSKENSVEYLQTLRAVREKCDKVLELAEQDKLSSFSLDLTRMKDATEMIKSLIAKDYGSIDTRPVALETLKNIPPHGRWRHFGSDNVDQLIQDLMVRHGGELTRVTRSVLDLFVVGVLVDAGAGDTWKYDDEKSGKTFDRSEGLALAALRMFQAGKFSSKQDDPWRVDSRALKCLDQEDIIKGFQVSKENPLLGVEGRLGLLHRLGKVIEEQSKYFPVDDPGVARPGALVDFLVDRGDLNVHIDVLWELVIKGFGGIWPESRTRVKGIALGDVWRCEALPGDDNLVPFHKLSQWLTYSLMEPMQKILGVRFVDDETMTGLAEYRNGGFFVDLGVITLKEEVRREGLLRAQANRQEDKTIVPLFAPDSQAIIEWRALTVALIDRLASALRAELNITAKELPLAKVLEAGTWKAGRILGKQLRPQTGGGPPIAIISDGTLF